MSPNVLSSVINWLACHLVVISLLGFGFVGLCVSQLIDCSTDDWLTGTRSTSAGAALEQRGEPPAVADREAAPPTARDDQRAPAPAPATAPGVVGQTAGVVDDHGAARPLGKAPKLIGGSIPVYERGAAAGAQSADGFRPSAAEPAAMPQAFSRHGFLQRARRAFWNGEFEAAEAAYIEMIAQYPGDADAFGELGNLYEAMGRPGPARDALVEAGIRLKLAGETERLQQVIDFLNKNGDNRVDQLMH